MSTLNATLDATVGVIGQGFVGGAVARAFGLVEGIVVETYDKYHADRTTNPLDELVRRSRYVFVCVPSPALPNGECDTSTVQEVVGDVAKTAKAYDDNERRIIVIKSTVPPGTTDLLASKYADAPIDIVFNPEFLNARSAFEDFISQEYVVLGGDTSACSKVAGLYGRLLQGDATEGARAAIVSARTAEMVKYTKNCFFAVKMSYAQEVYDMCRALDISYDQMIEVAKLDDRMGWEHWRVPGPTPAAGPWAGQQLRGWGNVCIPKDVMAFRRHAEDLGVDTKVLNAAWEKNLEVRPQRDWEYMPGAVKHPKKLEE